MLLCKILGFLVNAGFQKLIARAGERAYLEIPGCSFKPMFFMTEVTNVNQ